MPGTHHHTRRDNVKLRQARLEWEREAGQPIEPIRNRRVCPAWYRTTRANKPRTKHDPKQMQENGNG